MSGQVSPPRIEAVGRLIRTDGTHLFGSHHLRSPVGHRTAFGQDPRVRWAAYNEAKRGMQGKGDSQNAADKSRTRTLRRRPGTADQLGAAIPKSRVHRSPRIPKPAPM